MPVLAAALLLLAAPEPLRLTGPALDAPALPEGDARYWQAFFANQLRQQGIAVGPAESPDGAITGQLARLGSEGLQISIGVQSPAGETLAAFTETAHTADEIRGQLQRAAQELAGELFRRLQRRPVPQKAEPLPEAPARSVSSRLQPGVLGGVGVAVLGAAAAGAGLGLYLMAKDKLSAVARGAPASYFAAQQQANDARTLSTISVAVLGTGGLVFVCGVLYALYSGRVNTFIAVSPYAVPGESGVALTGALPW